jgi:hypothetical protein
MALGNGPLGLPIRILLVCIGIGAIITSIYSYSGYFMLTWKGKEAKATVASLDIVSYTNNRGTTYENLYVLEFDGHRVEKKLKNKLSTGKVVNVVYLPEKPNSVVVGEKNMSTYQLMGKDYAIWLLVFTIVGIFLAAIGIIDPLKNQTREKEMEDLMTLDDRMAKANKIYAVYGSEVLDAAYSLYPVAGKKAAEQLSVMFSSLTQPKVKSILKYVKAVAAGAAGLLDDIDADRCTPDQAFVYMKKVYPGFGDESYKKMLKKS